MYNADGQNDKVGRNGLALIMEPGGHRILRLCSDLRSAEGPDNQTQISFPVLSASGSLGFALLREWLQWCDKSHDTCKRHDEKKITNKTPLCR